MSRPPPPARKTPDADGADPRFVETLARPFRKLRDYCRLTVEGLENVPKDGAILVANHTGWIGLDHALLFLTVYDHDKRMPRTAVHPTYFRLPGIRDVSPKLGFFEVSVQESMRILDANGLVLFFPEAEDGNFKPISQLYELQPFKPGFARVALAAQAPVVPVVIVGGEEANPSLARIDLTDDVLGLKLPVPVNLVPFPVKWRIKFMPPIQAEAYLDDEKSVDEDVAARFARELRQKMQEELREQVRLRGNPFF